MSLHLCQLHIWTHSQNQKQIKNLANLSWIYLTIDMPPCWAVMCRFGPYWVQGGRFHCEFSGKKCVFYRLRGPGQPKAAMATAPYWPELTYQFRSHGPLPTEGWVELRRACQPVLWKKNSSPCSRKAMRGGPSCRNQALHPSLSSSYRGQVTLPSGPWVLFFFIKEEPVSQIFRLSED